MTGTHKQAPKQRPMQKKIPRKVTDQAPPPDDLVTARQAAALAGFATPWGFVRWARSAEVLIDEWVESGSGRLRYSKAELLSARFKKRAREASEKSEGA